MIYNLILLGILLFLIPSLSHAVKYTPIAKRAMKKCISNNGYEYLKNFERITRPEGDDDVKDSKSYIMKKISADDTRVGLRGKIGTWATKQFHKGEIIAPYLGIWMYSGDLNIKDKKQAEELMTRLEHDETFTKEHNQCCSDYQFDFPLPIDTK